MINKTENVKIYKKVEEIKYPSKCNNHKEKEDSSKLPKYFREILEEEMKKTR